MNIDVSALTSNAVIAVPIVIALVQAIKLTGFIPDHFAPLVAIVLGVGVSFIGNHDSGDLSSTTLYGALYGLMASGLYSGVKTTMLAHTRMKEERALKKHRKHQEHHHNHDKY